METGNLISGLCLCMCRGLLCVPIPLCVLRRQVFSIPGNCSTFFVGFLKFYDPLFVVMFSVNIKHKFTYIVMLLKKLHILSVVYFGKLPN